MPDEAMRTMDSRKETSCSRFHDLLLEYACDTLPPQLTEDLLLHLSTCQVCRKALAEHLHLRKLTQQAMNNLADLPPDSWARFQTYARKRIKAGAVEEATGPAGTCDRPGLQQHRAIHLRIVPALAATALEAALIPPGLSDLCGGALALWVNCKLRSFRSGGVEPEGYPAAG